VSEKVSQKNVLYTSRKSADTQRLPNYLFLCMLEGRNPFLNFIHTGATKLSLSAVIQTAVDPQHIQGLKKTRKNFTSAGRSSTNHIHRIARHEHKQVVQVQNTTPTSCHEQILDKNWIEVTAKIHIQQCLMPQLLRSNVLPHEVELLPVF
jgi:hypothetical protein